MSGWDHDFLVRAEPQWLIGRFVRRMRRRWPELVVGVDQEVLAPPGEVPSRFPEFVDVSKNRALQEWTYQNGAVSNEQGESSVGIVQFFKRGGYTQLDIITAEPRPHLFTEMVLGDFAAALVDLYRRESWPVLRKESRHTVEGRYEFEAPVDPAWMARTTLVCAQRRWAVAGGGLLTSVREGLELRVDVPGRDRIVTYTFTPVSGGRGGARLSVQVPQRAPPRWRQQAHAPLKEALAFWHFISYRSMKPRVAFTWPPGEPVLKGALVDFEGQGGDAPET